ncbi:sideroflexin-4 isoform X1 [Pseudonaja textilis]|uniref:sideroflexin-4 isoform X1 n=1 Tax=Pseudonaja textilis TaxID=8673 RepID=UPI000EAA08BE|nr:sideroflexin-4 isoform X1 [Pseudonaja textilis]
MDLNLQFWRNEGQTFYERWKHWVEILDPLVIFTREADINASRDLLLNSGENVMSSQDEKIRDAWKISLSCVNSSTGDTIPFFFRGGGFVFISASLAAIASLPYRTFLSSFCRQFVFQTYIGGFSLANRNSIKRPLENDEKIEFSWKQACLAVGSTPALALIGTLPHYFIERKKSLNTPGHFFSKFMASALFGVLCACNVFTVRNFERESGIKVMRSTGEVIGMSQVAGKKAVRETALSRGILFGVPVVISETSVYLINRRRLFPQKSMFLRGFLVYFFCWLILPVSLSWTPQLREIKRNELEPDLVSSTKETTFFFYRGV